MIIFFSQIFGKFLSAFDLKPINWSTLSYAYETDKNTHYFVIEHWLNNWVNDSIMSLMTIMSKMSIALPLVSILPACCFRFRWMLMLQRRLHWHLNSCQSHWLLKLSRHSENANEDLMSFVPISSYSRQTGNPISKCSSQTMPWKGMLWEWMTR